VLGGLVLRGLGVVEASCRPRHVWPEKQLGILTNLPNTSFSNPKNRTKLCQSFVMKENNRHNRGEKGRGEIEECICPLS
jgi:hypothetical protein